MGLQWWTGDCDILENHRTAGVLEPLKKIKNKEINNPVELVIFREKPLPGFNAADLCESVLKAT